MSDPTNRGFGLLGIGAAACVACCAGPVLAFLGGLGVAGALSTVIVGGFGLVVAALAATAYLVVRRRGAACAVPDADVPIAAPTRRAPEPTEVR
jgi:mercuric ion transport protein